MKAIAQGFQIWISPVFSEAGKGERASVFQGGRERQLRCGRFKPFVKSIRRNQTTAFVDFFHFKVSIKP
jgi:hypothetical protein